MGDDRVMTPEVGTELVNPVAQTRQVFTATAESTNGAYVEVEATYPPNSARPPVHKHPSQTETFTVISGALDVVRGDEKFTASAGQTFTVEAGVCHQLGATESGAVFIWRTSPALRTGEMFCALWEVARDAEWQADVAGLIRVLGEHEAEFCLC
jgi:quercetin dioxygenase-like cupin family protein